MRYLTESTRSVCPLGIGFWLQWVGITVFGFGLSLYWVEVGFKPEISSGEGAIGGAVIGLLQSLVLQRRCPDAWKWGIASAIAWGLLGFSHLGIVGWMAPRTHVLSLRLFYGMLHGLQAGLIVGLVQWLVLRSHTPRAWWWIPASGCSWAIGLSYGWVIGALLWVRTKLFLAEVLGLAAAWLLLAAITGMILAGLLNDRPRCQTRPRLETHRLSY